MSHMQANYPPPKLITLTHTKPIFPLSQNNPGPGTRQLETDPKAH